MTRRNLQSDLRTLQSDSLTASNTPVSHWPGKSVNRNVFPEDIQGRWYPTGWGAGCGPDLNNYQRSTETPSAKANSQSQLVRIPASVKPSFEIGLTCPNCGIAKLSLDADDCVSCPLCLFGGICDCAS